MHLINLLTATVADGGPDASQPDADYVPPPGTMGPGHEGNPMAGVSVDQIDAPFALTDPFLGRWNR